MIAKTPFTDRTRRNKPTSRSNCAGKLTQDTSQFPSQFILVHARADGCSWRAFRRISGPADPRAQHIADLKSGRSAVRSRPWPPAIPGPLGPLALAAGRTAAEGLSCPLTGPVHGRPRAWRRTTVSIEGSWPFSPGSLGRRSIVGHALRASVPMVTPYSAASSLAVALPIGVVPGTVARRSCATRTTSSCSCTATKPTCKPCAKTSRTC